MFNLKTLVGRSEILMEPSPQQLRRLEVLHLKRFFINAGLFRGALKVGISFSQAGSSKLKNWG